MHSTEVYVPLDINQSPFNVGLSVELPEFNNNQILDLAQRHQLDWNETEVEKLMMLVGGHPFLVHLTLYHIANINVTLINRNTTKFHEFIKYLRGAFTSSKFNPYAKAGISKCNERCSY